MFRKIMTLAAIAFSSLAFAQSPLGKSGKQLNVGFGTSSWGLPVYVGVDFGVHPDITVGPEISFRNYNQRFAGNRYRSSIIGISLAGNYHFDRVFNLPSAWNIYGGANLGFFIWNNEDNYPGTGSSGVGLGLQVGARYFFTNNFGINLEFGGGNAFGGGKLGITYIF